ncbi:hypothetical protein [Cellulomonas dongxiuzhuiae]|uniref:MinD-like ATPase involved in chromosome partitioning or flagellar assembly n=1 Tax=Cellulomonas dongxiuzhuiae TaxID=2819979 RepID=A0ABX8GK65_9CELL|nr:hypothetical protein [Cellulomonas dongxiuzhuiae]MBO3095608.1 hypothetical protein [Cellulomonas dongxiuzhuiae]QWC16574.1 hypothetical protein KKR89_02595 [Cellulomonas dongxiuzhuiae]
MGALAHLVAGAVPDRVDELLALDAAVRAPLPLSTRVGVVGTGSGVGCSVVAGLLAATLAARRPGRVLAVDASAGGRSVLWHAGCTEPARSTPAQHAARRAAQSGADAVAGLVRTPGGVHCLDLTEDGTAPDRTWQAAVGPVSRFFDVVVTDHGARTARAAGPVAATASVVCVVAEADRRGWQQGVDLASGFAAAGLPVVLAVDATARRAPAWCATAVRISPLPVVVVPHDRAHDAPQPVPARSLRPATTRAALRLAAAVLAASQGGRTVPGAAATDGAARTGRRVAS